MHGHTTNRTIRGLRVTAGLIGVGFVLAACGSSGSSSNPPASSSPVASSAAVTSAVPSSAAPSTAAVAGANPSSSFCLYAKAQQAQEAAEEKAITSDNPQQLQAFETQALAALTKLTASAPSQVKGAVQTIVTADQALFAALKAAGYNYTKVSPGALAKFDTPALAQAAKTITAYLKTSCGISATASP
jgi:hypothetical protein